jgi:hypothetical protein
MGAFAMNCAAATATRTKRRLGSRQWRRRCRNQARHTLRPAQPTADPRAALMRLELLGKFVVACIVVLVLVLLFQYALR